MATKTKSIEQYRADYKVLQDHAGTFGVSAADFNTRVRSLLGRGTPTPLAWTHNARQVAESISRGRCCPKAVVVPCMCEVSYKCPDHGVRCRGSHD
jgi:hypothetical protein